MENLENVIESILFVAGEPVSVSDLCFKFDLKQKDIDEAVEKLQQKYAGASGIKILSFNKKLQLSTNSDYVNEVSAILNPIRERNLTRATLETIAIVAYKQPVTRMDIEEIRGVNSDYAINILLEHKLIEVQGHKDSVGKPALFGTTDEFLKRFNISSVSDLPDYNDLLENIQKIRENYSDSLFKHDELPVEEKQTSEVDLDKTLEALANSDGTAETDFDSDLKDI